MINKPENQDTENPEDFEIFPWNEKFNTGHERIDEQHRTLARLVNRLARAMIEKDYSVLSSTFDELAKYAHLHFMDEESVWLRYFDEDDPWFSSHQHTHDSFWPKVNQLQLANSDKPLHEGVENIMQYLIRWLAFHIVGEDKRMANAIRLMESGMTIDQAKIIADAEMKDSLYVLIDVILNMYDRLCGRTMAMLRERRADEKNLEEAGSDKT
ncbi:MAG: hemerythrin family protein, partial [Thiotrichales bacterium]